MPLPCMVHESATQWLRPSFQQGCIQGFCLDNIKHILIYWYLSLCFYFVVGDSLVVYLEGIMEFVIVGFCGGYLGFGVCEIASLYCPGWPKTSSPPSAFQVLGFGACVTYTWLHLPVSSLLKESPMPLDLGELANMTGESMSGFPVKHAVTSALKMSATPACF